MVAGLRGSSDSSVFTLGKSFWAGKLPVDFGVEMPMPRLMHDLNDFRRVQEASVHNYCPEHQTVIRQLQETIPTPSTAPGQQLWRVSRLAVPVWGLWP